MKIELLLEREPFGSILEETLARFLESKTGESHRVSWREGLPRRDETSLDNVGVWLCNPRINALYSTDAQRQVFETPWREYLRGPSPLHTIGHAAYLLGATTPIGRSRLASHHVLIEPNFSDSASVLILGGNTRLRWIDVRGRTVTSILKAGFDQVPLRREIELRRGRDDLLAPPIVEELDEGLAFTEPLIRGTVADRLFSNRRAEEAIVEAVEAVDRLAEKSRHVVAWSDWWPSHRQKCEAAAGRIQSGNRDVVRRALDLTDEIGVLVASRNAEPNAGVEVTLSHGDFQAGNVLVEGDKTWLIDWERVDNRVAGYDIFTLALESRRGHSGLLDRADRLLGGFTKNRFDARAGEILLSMGGSAAAGRLLLYLLEEIRFHLEESGMGPLYGPSTSLEELTGELEELMTSKLGQVESAEAQN